jgi:hypothetical protein
MTDRVPAIDDPKWPLNCTAAEAREVVADLYRLIEALDRRGPRLERAGEAQIATDAAELRQRALNLIHLIESGASTA